MARILMISLTAVVGTYVVCTKAESATRVSDVVFIAFMIAIIIKARLEC